MSDKAAGLRVQADLGGGGGGGCVAPAPVGVGVGVALCERCGEEEACGDAAAFEFSTGLDRDPDTTHDFPGWLDGVCEGCLDGALKDALEEGRVSAAEDRADDVRAGWW